ncbi:MAG: hypothetical protein JWO46_1065 [Nocardioidaceae bacterium]|nr:hypothetical protein [Nocardioidaceae bacterium]
MSDRPVKIPDASHPITVTPTAERVRVYAGDTLIADTTESLTLQESTYPAVQYVPLSAIDPAVLSTTETSTYCPFKGDATYYSVTTPEGTVVDAGWNYAAAYEAVAEIKDHVAWYPDRVRLVVG